MVTSGISTIRPSGSFGRARSLALPHISRSFNFEIGEGRSGTDALVFDSTFSDNEVHKGELTMQLKRLHRTQEALSWPSEKSDLPVITWEDCKPRALHAALYDGLMNILSSDQRQAESRTLICIAGFIHDISDFFDKHPGGPQLLKKSIGKDATTAFFGGLYDHSRAAHNVRVSPSCRRSS
jgi:hypothetical protein